MNTFIELGQGYFAVVAFAFVFLSPGYLWASCFDLAGFRNRSSAEKLLWTVAMSTPLTVAICALLSRLLPHGAINTIFAALDVIGLIFLFRSPRQRSNLRARATKFMFVLMALFGLYCVAAVVDIQIGHKLFPSTVIADWSVRVQMVKAAMRSGVPPINGLSTLNNGAIGHAPHLRYFYFWYVTVAQIARTFHLEASAALAASSVWAGWSLIATVFLALKYFAEIRDRLQAKCFLGLLIGGVLGLDILPTALLWLSPKLHPYPEMEWWHQDRTPSFLGAVLYAPHHMAAFAMLFCAWFTLFLAVNEGERSVRRNWIRFLPVSIFSGVAFAAAAGTSVFPTFCFVFVLAIWALDLMRRRQWHGLAALAVAGALGLVFAHGYLHELASGSSAASSFAGFRWRNDDFFALQFARHHLFARLGPFPAFLLRQPAVLFMNFFEFGFYALVLVAVFRRDLLRAGRLTAGRCALWALLFGAAIPFFFLSSTGTSGPNDLGVDAGFLLRLGLQMCAVPWVWGLWKDQRQANARGERISLLYVSAAVLFVLGLSAQVYQAVSERLYYPIIGSGIVHKQMDAFTQDRFGERLYNIRSAWREFDRMVPPSQPDTQAVQFNPIGPMQPAETIYSNHQIASWDTGCGTSYGGDYKSCAPVYADLLFLFGNTQAGFDAGRAENDRQDGAATRTATSEDFARTCNTLHVRAMMAESTDAIWKRKDSWVWTAPPLVQNDTVRILACPAK